MIAGIGLAASCGDIPTCVDTDSNLVQVDFLDTDGSAKDITLTSLKAIGNEGGFPEFADSTLNKLALSLNPGALTTTFILEQTSGKIDTIGLSYSVVARLISPECGLDAAFDNMDTTFTSYNKLVILDSRIHEEIITNIEITL